MPVVCRMISASESYTFIAVSLLHCLTAADGVARAIANTRGAAATFASLLGHAEDECRFRVLLLLRQLCFDEGSSSPCDQPSEAPARECVARTRGVARGVLRTMGDAMAVASLSGSSGASATGAQPAVDHELLLAGFAVLSALTCTRAGFANVKRELIDVPGCKENVETLETAVR